MINEPIFYPICQHRGTGALYFYRGQNLFENIVTKQSGIVEDSVAEKAFYQCPDLSQMVFEHPLVCGLLEIGFKLK